jgi:hypothetical protein
MISTQAQPTPDTFSHFDHLPEQDSMRASQQALLLLF